MKKRGADVVVQALRDAGAKFAFGIPGTHNIELYDAIDREPAITPILVTDEQAASFMADAVSRSSGGVGVLNVVPGAGVTHALSGVAEAFMDNVPMVVLASGIRDDTGRAYQLHAIDQLALLKPITKATLKVEGPGDLYPKVREAFDLAVSGAPGPVAVEVPANYYILTQNVPEVAYQSRRAAPTAPDAAAVAEAARLLAGARQPILYVGNGAAGAGPLLVELAERLAAPVATTISGKGVFPESHALWLWNGLGRSAPPFVRKVEGRADVMLAIGCRFGEVATASYGFEPPATLIHVDIEPAVLNANYPAKLALAADARLFVEALLQALPARRDGAALGAEIAAGHGAVQAERAKPQTGGKVSPAALFRALQKLAGRDAIYVTDSGNGTFLAMEHLRLDGAGRFLAPVDYSSMGYAVPGAVGAKLANPQRDVIALAGDGALLMTGLEMLTAANYGIAPLVCVLHDGELSQIAQFQNITLNRDTCSVLPDYSVEAFAAFTRCDFLRLATDAEAEAVLAEALKRTRAGKPVMVDVAIDYSQKTYFTKGAVTTNFWRLPWGDRLRLLGRAVGRRLPGG